MPAVFRSSFFALLFLLASVSLAQTPPPPGPPFRVGGDVRRPEKISGSPPVYTVEARKDRVTGVVILEAIIDEQGNVTDVKVLKGLPAGLDQAAVKAVETWKFRPATLDGRPVPVYYTLTVNFTMETDLTFGPLLSQFMKENPDFGELVTHKRFGEALSLLEGRDASPETRLARVYVLSALRRLDEAWEEAQAYDGADPYEVFHQVAFAALNAAAGSYDEKARAGFLEIGLQAATQAMDAREGDKQAMITKSQLLREKAKLTLDPQRAALLYEASELEKKAGIAQ
ncbi:MAG TPA: energy transducer TonB [Thermoanaerobaculia bacterium]|nr:energy transducer TonB [Thermoanaerobaculia bacterium]